MCEKVRVGSALAPLWRDWLLALGGGGEHVVV